MSTPIGNDINDSQPQPIIGYPETFACMICMEPFFDSTEGATPHPDITNIADHDDIRDPFKACEADCLHHFHTHCIGIWFDSGKDYCPACNEQQISIRHTITRVPLRTEAQYREHVRARESELMEERQRIKNLPHDDYDDMPALVSPHEETQEEMRQRFENFLGEIPFGPFEPLSPNPPPTLNQIGFFEQVPPLLNLRYDLMTTARWFHEHYRTLYYTLPSFISEYVETLRLFTIRCQDPYFDSRRNILDLIIQKYQRVADEMTRMSEIDTMSLDEINMEIDIHRMREMDFFPDSEAMDEFERYGNVLEIKREVILLRIKSLEEQRERNTRLYNNPMAHMFVNLINTSWNRSTECPQNLSVDPSAGRLIFHPINNIGWNQEDSCIVSSRLRLGIQGKRADFTTRSVITHCPDVSTDILLQLEVPVHQSLNATPDMNIYNEIPNVISSKSKKYSENKMNTRKNFIQKNKMINRKNMIRNFKK